MKLKVILYVIILVTFVVPNNLPQQSIKGNNIILYLVPFENRTGDRSLDWLRNGFMDMIATHFQFSDVVSVRFEKDLNKLIKEGKRREEVSGETLYYLIIGDYKSIKDTLSVEIQLLDALSWLTVDIRKLKLSKGDFSSVSDRLSREVDDMLRIQFLMKKEKKPKTEELVKKEPEKEKEPQRFTKQAKTVKKQLDVAVRDLETTLDEYLGYKPHDERDTYQEGTYYVKDIRSAASEEELPVPQEDAYSLTRILEDLTINPYLVNIGKLKFEGIPLNPDYIRVIFPVEYRLKKDLLTEMLEIVPLNNVKHELEWTAYELRKDIFRVDESILHRISKGEFRMFPIIELVSPDENTKIKVLDIPKTFYFRYEKDQPLKNISSFIDFNYTILKSIPGIYFTTYFKPMININSSLYSVTVYLSENPFEKIVYTIDVPIDVMSKISRIKVHFENEELIQSLIYQ